MFPRTARELYPDADGGPRPGGTLGLYRVGDEGKMALVHGERLVELEPVETAPGGRGAVMCELCKRTLSRGDALFYRVRDPRLPRRYHYVALCRAASCQKRVGPEALKALSDRFWTLPS
nr:hypothetical protein [Deinobacterium chartae]